MSTELIVLAGITLVASFVNGALGYGFSSITVPVALLFFTNRILNPPLVLLEFVINGFVFIVNIRSIPRVWGWCLPVIVGLIPGVIIGSAVLTWVNATWLKLLTFAVLLPLILLQAAGIRRRLKGERSAGFALGGAVGVLYTTTTISGPPLALMLNNQGVAKQEFRAALSVIRLAECVFTGVAYWVIGMYSRESLRLIPYVVPSILVGIPAGTWAIRHMKPETFRRICMSFDAWIVAFGLSRSVGDIGILTRSGAYVILVVTIAIDVVLLYRYFSAQPPLNEVIS